MGNPLPILVIKNKKNSNKKVHLFEILQEVKDGSSFNWIIQHLEALGNFENTDLMSYILKASSYDACYPIDWKTINELAKRTDDVFCMELLAFDNPQKIKVYDSDLDLIKNCKIAIIRFDATGWEIYSADKDLFERLQAKFKIDKQISPEDYSRKY